MIKGSLYADYSFARYIAPEKRVDVMFAEMEMSHNKKQIFIQSVLIPLLKHNVSKKTFL